VCIDDNDVVGRIDFSDQYIVIYSMTRRRMKDYNEIFCHLLVCIMGHFGNNIHKVKIEITKTENQ
jgi:hypothetical protein